MKKILWPAAGIIMVSCIILILRMNDRVSDNTRIYLYQDASLIPCNRAGVLLGTSKYIRRGVINEFWQNRIDAAVILYHSGKIRYLIISGDNSTAYYNEPFAMKKELVRCGIPDSVIFPDYAGFCTFDSMIRAYKVFGQSSFTVISQEFHNQRAVYIARHYGIGAIGFNAKGVPAWYGLRTNLREKLARVKMFIDLWMEKQPRFLGEKIRIS